MKVRQLFYPLVAIVALAVLAAACADGDGEGEGSDEQTSAVRTEKGLAVAARVADLGLAPQLTGAEGLAVAAPAAGGDAALGKAPASGVVIDDRGLSPYPFPAFQQSQSGLTVQGFGSATADADGATLELYFGTSFKGEPVPMPRAVPEGDADAAIAAEEPAPPPTDPALQEVEPITEADLQPVIDAIVAAGIDRSDIEFVGQGYYDPYFASATLRVTIDDVTLIDAVVDAARGASSGLEGIDLQSSNVLYTLSDCTGLEIAAMRAAIEDAGERVASFAEALAVGVGPVVGAANYSYTPFEGTTCSSGYGYYPLGFSEGSGSTQVEVFASIVVTYAIQ